MHWSKLSHLNLELIEVAGQPGTHFATKYANEVMTVNLPQTRT